MRWSNIKTTIFKELRGIVRDKKSMGTIIYMPLIIPAFIILMGFMFDVMSKTDYNIGINYKLDSVEEEIIKEIGDLNFKYYDTLEDLSKAYENKDITAYIVKIDKNYIVYSNQSNNSGKMVSSYISSYLDEYNRYLASDYLKHNGIDPNSVYNNINYKLESLGSKNINEMVTILLSMSVTYILMIIVMSCGVVATDATAGEKERATLETILTFPVKSSELITGKYIAITLFGVLLGLISLLFTFPSIFIGKKMFKAFSDITVNLSASSIGLLILLIIISSLLVAGISMALSGKAKTYKEAQSSLQFLSFLPMLPYFLEILEIDNSIFSFVPIANCGMALNDIIMDKVNTETLLIIIGTTIVYTVLIIFFVSKQYKQEKTLFL